MKQLVRYLFPLLLLAVAWSPAARADKPVVGVAEFTNDTNAGWWGRTVGEELSGLVTNEMASSGKFSMVERNRLDTVLQEQDLAASGRISKGSSAKVGKLTGAQYIVLGTVTSYEEQVSGGGGGFSYKGISIGGRKDEAYIAIDLRVVNTTTGAIDYSRTVEAKSGGGGMDVGIYRHGFGGHLGGYEKTPAGRAIRAVIAEITDYLGCVMVDRDQCMDEFAAKEEHRRENLKKSIKLY